MKRSDLSSLRDRAAEGAPALKVQRRDRDHARDLLLPPTATHSVVGFVGLLASAIAYGAVLRLEMEGYQKAMFVIMAVAGAMIMIDVLFFRTYRRATAGLAWDRPQSLDLRRVGVKLAGLASTVGLIAFAYWVLPEYGFPGNPESFYRPYYNAVASIWPVLAVGAVVYFTLVDGRMVDPEDGYYQMGRAVLFQWRDLDGERIRAHLRSWLIKAFFVPLMFVYLVGNLQGMPGMIATNWQSDFMSFFLLAQMFLYTIDLTFAVVGYIFAFRLLDTHERSSEPTMLGWAVALLCYQPFWSFFSQYYIKYEDDLVWDQFFDQLGVPFLKVLWGVGILVLIAIYAWATVVFGLRFSNLTHRGILTNGPYRFTKHPAYITKNLSWWMASIPFISHAGPGEAFRLSVSLLLLNGVYWLRAYTEERHLERDPAYRAYQDWIRENGMFRFLNRK
jgi:protein-S-isoprenylcysteine O-methyltransferase Ste14